MLQQDTGLDAVLESVQQHTEKELPEVIVEKHDWSHMYHLSQARTNLIEWIPVTGGQRVLEVGAECGALTGMLAAKAGAVTALELNEKKIAINKIRNKQFTNIKFLQGGLEALTEEETKSYDYIFLIGSLPLAEEYQRHPEKAEADSYKEMVTRLKQFLKDDGHMVIALPNKLGLKYFAGCREDYFGAPFTGIEDYYYHKGMKTFGKTELTGLLNSCGFTDCQWYYPYPDYRFMNTLYSEKYLPKFGELNGNLCNFDQDRYVFFDETKVYDNLIREGLFEEFANSFLIITGKEQVSDLVYTKYSAERDREFALRTDILENKDCHTVPQLYSETFEGEFYAAKTALFGEGRQHVDHIRKACDELSAFYSGSGIEIDPCRKEGNGVAFEYISGETLQQIMERYVIAGQTDKLLELVAEYQTRISRNCRSEFEVTEEFRLVFGDVRLPEHLKAMDVSDIDLIFSNVIVTSEGRWKVIDYEWTFDFKVPLHFVLYRAYFFASHQIMKCDTLELDRLLEFGGITAEEVQAYEQMEKHFQEYVIKNRFLERDMLGLIGNAIIPFAWLDESYHKRPELEQQIRELTEENGRLRTELEHTGFKSVLKKKIKH